jgi:hypothetical protein
VVVAADGPPPLVGSIRAFLSSGSLGVNYRRNTWHHSLIAAVRVGTARKLQSSPWYSSPFPDAFNASGMSALPQT